MTPLTPTRSLLVSAALVLAMLACQPVQAQAATASAPASAPMPAPTPAQEPTAAASANPAAGQGLRYGAGYQARQLSNRAAATRAQQAPAHRRGRGR